MTAQRDYIQPVGWQNHKGVAGKPASFLADLTRKMQMEYIENDFEGHFQIWGPSSREPDKLFISHGVRHEDPMEYGTGSILFAFGFFYGDALHWPEGYLERRCKDAMRAWIEFAEADTPKLPETVDDANVLERCAFMQREAMRCGAAKIATPALHPGNPKAPPQTATGADPMTPRQRDMFAWENDEDDDDVDPLAD